MEQNKLKLTLESETDRLIRLKQLFEKLKLRKNILEEEFKKENHLFFEEYEINRDRLNSAEENVRILAIERYKETNNKILYKNIGIRIMTKLEYSQELALEWAKQHNLALELDKKSFEKIAKMDNTDIDFVKINKEPQATIPKYLE